MSTIETVVCHWIWHAKVVGALVNVYIKFFVRFSPISPKTFFSSIFEHCKSFCVIEQSTELIYTFRSTKKALIFILQKERSHNERQSRPHFYFVACHGKPVVIVKYRSVWNGRRAYVSGSLKTRHLTRSRRQCKLALKCILTKFELSTSCRFKYIAFQS